MNLLYIHTHLGEIEKWGNGWKHNQAPSLVKMINVIQEKWGRENPRPGPKLTAHMDSLVHGKTDSAVWNIDFVEGYPAGHAASKNLGRPDLYDDLCASVIPILATGTGHDELVFSREWFSYRW